MPKQKTSEWRERFDKEFTFKFEKIKGITLNNEPLVKGKVKDLKQFIAMEIIEAQRQAFKEGYLACCKKLPETKAKEYDKGYIKGLRKGRKNAIKDFAIGVKPPKMKCAICGKPFIPDKKNPLLFKYDCDCGNQNMRFSSG